MSSIAAPRRPTIPKSVARRLDRIAYRAHAFHRWSHHPLCVEYESERIALGRRTRLCRGCAFLAIGGAAGLSAGILAPPLPSPWPVLSLALLGAIGLFGLYIRMRRERAQTQAGSPRSKIATRLLPGAGFTFVAVQATRTGGPIGAAALGVCVLAAVAFTVAYRRLGPYRGPCTTCPEARLGVPCRGFREIVQRERAFGRFARRVLARLP
jgi:hypothetical protein